MSLLELRILPPLAIARLGASEHPLENYDLKDSQESGPGFRKIVPAETLDLDIASGEIVGTHMPKDPVPFRMAASSSGGAVSGSVCAHRRRRSGAAHAGPS